MLEDAVALMEFYIVMENRTKRDNLPGVLPHLYNNTGTDDWT